MPVKQVTILVSEDGTEEFEVRPVDTFILEKFLQRRYTGDHPESKQLVSAIKYVRMRAEEQGRDLGLKHAKDMVEAFDDFCNR